MYVHSSNVHTLVENVQDFCFKHPVHLLKCTEKVEHFFGFYVQYLQMLT